MTDLVGQNVAEGEVSSAAEMILHVAVEGQIQIDLFVSRAVEGAHGRLAVAAGRRCLPRVKHEPGRAVLLPGLSEDAAPGLLRGFEHDGDEAPHFVLRRARSGLSAPASAGLSGVCPLLFLHLHGQAGAFQKRRQIVTVERGHDDNGDHDEACLSPEGDAAPHAVAAAPSKGSSASAAAPVFHIAASFAILPAHGSSSSGRRPVPPRAECFFMPVSVCLSPVPRPRFPRAAAGKKPVRRKGTGGLSIFPCRFPCTRRRF